MEEVLIQVNIKAENMEKIYYKLIKLSIAFSKNLWYNLIRSLDNIWLTKGNQESFDCIACLYN